MVRRSNVMVKRTMCVVGVAGLALAAACGDGFIRDADVVARAGDHELRVDEVAQWLDEGRTVPLRREVLERFIQRWVEYSLYAQRLARGDSLTDSLTVLRVMWPDIEQAKLDVMHESLVKERVKLDSATVDSAYSAGDDRIICHILIRSEPGGSAAQQSRARQRATAVREQALAGTPWSELNERHNEDPGAKPAGGNLGMVRRPDLTPAFGDVAFALEPGEISQVTETSFGYHVIWRPELSEVYDQFREQIRLRLVAQMDSLYYSELDDEWQISVRDDAPARVREVAEAPLEAVNDDHVLGTYRGGRFTIADLVRWLHVLSAQVHQQLFTMGDADLRDFLRSLMRNEVMIRLAREQSIAIPEEVFRRARGNYLTDLRRLHTSLRLDSALAGASTPEERQLRARGAADRYVARVMRTLRDVVIVPPFLANDLRRENRWEVSGPALDRVIGMASELRAPRDTAVQGGAND